MATFISHRPAETEALGETWGREAETGLVIGLCGELGAGKTQLVRGLARGLGSPERVHSPTFTLVNVYSGGRLTLFHLDLYRLDTPEQILRAGLHDYLRMPGVTVIEWADKWFEVHSSPQTVHSPHLKTSSRQAGVTDHVMALCDRLRWVLIESQNQTTRRILHEDLSL